MGYQQMPITPFNPPDPMEGIQKGLQLRNMQQSGQLQRQAIQENAMKLQQEKQGMADQQAFRVAMTDPSMQGKTIGDVADVLAKNGRISLQAYQGAKKADLDHRKELAALDKTNFENRKSAHDVTQQLYNNVMQMPDDQMAAQWPQIAQQYNAIPGNEKMPLNPRQPLTKQELAQFAPVIDMGNAYFDQELKRRESQLELTGKQLTNQHTAAQLPGGGIFAANEADKAATRELTKRGQDITMRGQNMVDARDAKKTAFDESLVDEIGKGKMAPSRIDYILARKPELLAAVADKYPEFDSSKVKSYADTYHSFTGSGKDAMQLAAGATAIRHLDRLKQINDQNPTEVRIPGTASNKAYNNLLDTVADELVTFYGEPKTNEAMASKKRTLGGLMNRDAAITEQAKAMGEKFDELEQKWNNAAPSAAYQAPMPGISTAAMAARARLDPRYKPGRKITPTPTQGGTATHVWTPDGLKPAEAH